MCVCAFVGDRVTIFGQRIAETFLKNHFGCFISFYFFLTERTGDFCSSFKHLPLLLLSFRYSFSLVGWWKWDDLGSDSALELGGIDWWAADSNFVRHIGNTGSFFCFFFAIRFGFYSWRDDVGWLVWWFARVNRAALHIKWPAPLRVFYGVWGSYSMCIFFFSSVSLSVSLPRSHFPYWFFFSWLGFGFTLNFYALLPFALFLGGRRRRRLFSFSCSRHRSLQ